MGTSPEKLRRPLRPSPIPLRPVKPLAGDEIQQLLREIILRLDAIEKRLDEIEKLLLCKSR
jgi:hypothetical protein